MKEGIRIQKELTERDFRKIATKFHYNLKQITEMEIFVRYLQIIIKEITPAKEVELIFPDTIQAIRNTKNAILSRCYHYQKAFFTNDVDRETTYNAMVDNFISEKMQKILCVPLVSDGEVTAIIAAGIPYRDLNQFTWKDIAYIERLEIPQRLFQNIKNRATIV